MATIIKFRMISDEVEDFVRDYEIDLASDLLALHDLICADLEYDPEQFSSFFLSNANWDKLQEYTLDDMDDDDGGVVALPMEGTLIEQVITAERERMMFMFDLLAARSFYMEVVEIRQDGDEENYPRVAYSAGNPPHQENAESIFTDDSAFMDAMGDFADFDGSDEYSVDDF